MKQTINVTREHIDEGRRLIAEGKIAASKCCAVALAMEEVAPGFAVGRTVVISMLLHEVVARLPVEVVIFTQMFDRGLPVWPFSFELEFYDDKLAAHMARISLDSAADERDGVKTSVSLAEQNHAI